jgi:hypothetical protein
VALVRLDFLTQVFGRIAARLRLNILQDLVQTLLEQSATEHPLELIVANLSLLGGVINLQLQTLDDELNSGFLLREQAFIDQKVSHRSVLNLHFIE